MKRPRGRLEDVNQAKELALGRRCRVSISRVEGLGRSVGQNGQCHRLIMICTCHEGYCTLNGHDLPSTALTLL